MSVSFTPTNESTPPDSHEDGYEPPLDLQRELVPRPASTFFLVSDTQQDGVAPGDVLVVDRSLRPARGYLVIAEQEGDLRLRRYPVSIVWGVVTYVIHKTW